MLSLRYIPLTRLGIFKIKDISEGVQRKLAPYPYSPFPQKFGGSDRQKKAAPMGGWLRLALALK